MALSNWDTLAFGEDGSSCSGAFGLRGDAVLSIYKNWIYIRQPSGWMKESGFGDNVVMQVDHAKMSYAGCDILVEREEMQQACFVFVTDDDYKGNPRFFAGIGCFGTLEVLEYAQIHNPDRLSMLPEGWDDVEFFFSFEDNDGAGVTFPSLTGEGVDSLYLYGPDEEIDRDTGVSEGLYERFISWLEGVTSSHVDARAWFEKVKEARPLRYNQGDAFFAAHFDTTIPATNIGENGPSILKEALGSEE